MNARLARVLATLTDETTLQWVRRAVVSLPLRTGTSVRWRPAGAPPEFPWIGRSHLVTVDPDQAWALLAARGVVAGVPERFCFTVEDVIRVASEARVVAASAN